MSEPFFPTSEIVTSNNSSEFVQQVSHALENRPHGDFYRYMSVNALRNLITTGESTFNGKTAYDRVVGEKFNPMHIPDRNIMSCYFVRTLRRHFIDVPDSAKNLSMQLTQASDEVITVELQKLEKRLAKQNKKYVGLTNAFNISIAEKDTSSIVEYFKKIGGDETMIALQRMGWDADPEGAFSDLVSVSVGAPMYFSGSEDIVVVELDFSQEELSIPATDHANEHEVMVRRITASNLRKVYAPKDNEALLEYLTSKYPESFIPDEGSFGFNPLVRFAQRVPLERLLKQLGIS